MKKKVKRCRIGPLNYPYFFKYFFVVLAFWIAFVSLYIVVHIYPETTMVLNSKCENPVQSWDGKLFGIPLWYNSLRLRPRYFNLHHELEYFEAQSEKSNMKKDSFLRTFEGTKNGIGSHRISPKNQPLIIWGSHHKTGTFVAQKIFSKICTIMKWCCKFHVTRDSLHAVQHSLKENTVNVIAHNQWIWNPHKDFNLNNFYFFHFYRHPWKKIISSYNYHYSGSEKWNKKVLSYSKICSNAEVLINESTVAVQKSADFPKLLRNRIFDYCHSVQLCESCCRKDHEKYELEMEKLHDVSESAKTIHHKMQSVPKKIEYDLRSSKEYEFMCKTLGRIPPNTTLQEFLMSHSVEEGLLIEAGLNYYEILRMTKLLLLTNSEFKDIHTGDNYINRVKHVDLDILSNKYDSVSRELISELSELIPSKAQRDAIHSAIQFYDLKNSPIYLWSMRKHVTSKSMSYPSSNLEDYYRRNITYLDSRSALTTEIRDMTYWKILDTHPTIQLMYKPIFAMLSKL
jgi:hypothetical protein